ncbi:MAG TPA: thermonuclease family protein, partial [bacterium]|nr:thermonuclease family protein [bacterium]
MKRASIAILFVLMVFAAMCLAAELPAPISAKVIRVVDGDTLKISIDGREDTVRLIGVDTPETVHPNKPVEFFGREASAFTHRMADGKNVRLEFDQASAATKHRDRYGRLLAYVFLPDGTLLNSEIIRQGYGHAYTKYPFSRKQEFVAIEREAREARRGFWAQTEDTSSAMTPTPSIAPPDERKCKIKGNINARGDRIYHVPGQEHYEIT